MEIQIKSNIQRYIVLVIGLFLCPTVIFAQKIIQDSEHFEHHAYLTNNRLGLSTVEAFGYNNFHGCEIQDVYNIVDSCYMEIGDEKSINIYHLAILSPDFNNGKKYDLFSDRLLLIKKGEDTFIYDNVISNEPIIEVNTDPYKPPMDDKIIVPCEYFFIPSDDENNGTFNYPCDFELVCERGQGYKTEWSIGIKIVGSQLYIIGLSFVEHSPGLDYQKRIAFEYEEGKFPLEKFRRSMLELVRQDNNPWPE